MNLNLADLEPEWCKDYNPTIRGFKHTELGSEAQGIWFLCPVCFVKNKGPMGTHMVLVWFKDRGVPDTAEPLPRWTATGTTFFDLTLMPSIDTTKNKAGEVVNPHEWHGFITAGKVT